jgi:hypothetical protein
MGVRKQARRKWEGKRETFIRNGIIMAITTNVPLVLLMATPIPRKKGG